LQKLKNKGIIIKSRKAILWRKTDQKGRTKMLARCPRCKRDILLPSGITKGKTVCPTCAAILNISKVEDDVTVSCPNCKIQFQLPKTTKESDLIMCPACAKLLKIK
jgi:DNA-directed RNA polymerase subunit RPC12/RpoP